MTEAKHTPTLKMHPLPWSLDAEEACILDATGDAVQYFEEADERECEYHALIVSAVNAYTASPEPPAHDDAVVERVAKAIYESQPLFMSGIGMDVSTLKQVPWAELDERDRNDALESARAAIAAMPAQSPLLNEAAEVLQDILNMLRAAHMQCGVHHDGNKRVIRARAFLAKLGQTNG